MNDFIEPGQTPFDMLMEVYQSQIETVEFQSQMIRRFKELEISQVKTMNQLLTLSKVVNAQTNTIVKLTQEIERLKSQNQNNDK